MWVCLATWLSPDAALADSVGRGLDQYAFNDADRLTSASAFLPWMDMMRRRANEPFSIEGCVASLSSCTPSMRGARSVVLRGRVLSLNAQLQLVNRFVNRRRYAEHALGKRWETPADFLRQGGDCEDYAVTKYFLLRAIGIPANDLRVVIGRTRQHVAHHALLAVRAAGTVLLLDTDDRLLAGRNRSDYLYLYSINEDSLWDHAGNAAPATL